MNKESTERTSTKAPSGEPQYLTFSGEMPESVVRNLDRCMQNQLRLPPEGFELGMDLVEHDGERWINIDHFQIAPEYRNEGHGTDLLQTLRDFFAEADVGHILIHMKTPDTDKGRQFVKNLDFELVDDVTTDERLTARYNY